MQRIIIALVFMIMMSTASANPCNLDLNTSTQEDYAAIVLAGCDPFAMLRQRRLGRPRAQRLDVLESLALSGMLTPGAGADTTGTTATNNALNWAYMGMDNDNLAAMAALNQMNTANPADASANPSNNFMNAMMMSDIIDRRLRSPRVEQKQNTAEAAALDDSIKDMLMVRALTGGQNSNMPAAALMGLDDDMGRAMAMASMTAPNSAGASAGASNALTNALIMGDVIDRRLRSPRVEQKQNTAEKAALDDNVQDMLMIRALTGQNSNMPTAALLALGDNEDAAMMSLAAGAGTSAGASNGLTNALIMSDNEDAAMMSLAAGAGTSGGASNGLASALFMSDNEEAGMMALAAGDGTSAGASNGLTNALIMGDVIDRRLRSPRVEQKQNTAEAAALDDSIKDMIMVQALTGGQNSNMPAAALLALGDNEDAGMMALASMTAPGAAGAPASNGLINAAIMSGAIDRRLRSPRVQQVATGLGRRLRKPRVQQNRRPYTKLVPIYRKVQ